MLEENFAFDLLDERYLGCKSCKGKGFVLKWDIWKDNHDYSVVLGYYETVKLKRNISLLKTQARKKYVLNITYAVFSGPVLFKVLSQAWFLAEAICKWSRSKSMELYHVIVGGRRGNLLKL